jgi:hypothetical protein
VGAHQPRDFLFALQPDCSCSSEGALLALCGFLCMPEISTESMHRYEGKLCLGNNWRSKLCSASSKRICLFFSGQDHSLNITYIMLDCNFLNQHHCFHSWPNQGKDQGPVHMELRFSLCIPLLFSPPRGR